MMKTMKPQHLVALVLLSACGSGGEEPKAGSAELTDGIVARALAPALSVGSGGMRCYESTDVDDMPDIALDRPFTYMVRYVVATRDYRALLSTVIPHAAGMTYELVDEGMEVDGTWKVTFKAYDDPAVVKGLFVHTNYRVPWIVEGKAITDVEVAVLDQSGNSTPELGGVPGEPKSLKPARRSMSSTRDEDPSLPPLEDVTIYANGGLVEGEQYIIGFARVNGAGAALTLMNDPATYTVAFANTTGTPAHEFLFFDHRVTDLGANPAVCAFTDGDADPGTEPRPTVQQP